MAQEHGGEKEAAEQEQSREHDEERAEALVPQRVARGDEAERAGLVARVMNAVITFGRSSAGVRIVRMPTTGALTSGTKNANAATMSTATGHDVVGESRNSGSGTARIPTAASFSSGPSARLLRDDRAGQRSDAEAGEEEAEHVRVRVVTEVGEPWTPSTIPEQRS